MSLLDLVHQYPVSLFLSDVEGVSSGKVLWRMKMMVLQLNCEVADFRFECPSLH